MKWWKTLLLCLAALLLALGLLVWFAPARWVVPWVNAHAHGTTLRDVEGSVWDGRAGALVAADGSTLGALHWTLSRRALLGRPDGHVELAGAAIDLRGDFSRDGETLRWRDVHLRLALDRLPAVATPWGRPLGVLQAEVAQATLRQGWPLMLDGQVHWQPAAIGTAEDRVVLGHLVATVNGREGVLQAALRDTGQGPLQLDGSVQASPLGWRIDLSLAPRGDDPALRRWLARLGPPGPGGAVHLRRGAGLGAVPLSTGVSR